MSLWLPQPNDNTVKNLKSRRWLDKLYSRYGNKGLLCLVSECVCVCECKG